MTYRHHKNTKKPHSDSAPPDLRQGIEHGNIVPMLVARIDPARTQEAFYPT
jgi:hypothetical protein